MRDPDLLLSLLREMAEKPDGRLTSLRIYLGMGEEERRRKHHVEILADAGHVYWPCSKEHPRITSAGYDFLAAADNHPSCMSKFLDLVKNGIPYLTAVEVAMKLLPSS